MLDTMTMKRAAQMMTRESDSMVRFCKKCKELKAKLSDKTISDTYKESLEIISRTSRDDFPNLIKDVNSAVQQIKALSDKINLLVKECETNPDKLEELNTLCVELNTVTGKQGFCG